MTVFTRDHDRTREDGEVSHEVCRKREHSEYNKKILWDKDIAILHLCKPLMFARGSPNSKPVHHVNRYILLAVGPICLPDPAQDYHNVKALVTDWGRYPEDMREVKVTTLTTQQCQKEYGRNYITENMICAGKGDPCQVEGGGPLAVPGEDKRYSQIGVQSWSGDCAKPGVYTRLSSLLDWLTPILIKPIQGLDSFVVFSFSFLPSYAVNLVFSISINSLTNYILKC